MAQFRTSVDTKHLGKKKEIISLGSSLLPLHSGLDLKEYSRVLGLDAPHHSNEEKKCFIRQNEKCCRIYFKKNS